MSNWPGKYEMKNAINVYFHTISLICLHRVMHI
jgi:hypothetical protein